MFSTSTVCSVDPPVAHPPTTIRAAPVHSAVDMACFVGMGGNSSVHLLPLPFPVRLNSWLVRVPLCLPRTRVRKLLMMSEEAVDDD